MKVFLISLATSFSLSATAQQTDATPYTHDACTKNCRIANESRTPIYLGQTPKSYRICNADAFDVEITVNTVPARVESPTNGIRHCVDVNGTQIMLSRGTALVGLLP